MRAEYEFDYASAIRGKYFRRLRKEGAVVVILEPDVAKAFGDSRAVNEALRSLLEGRRRSTGSRVRRRAGSKRTTARRAG